MREGAAGGMGMEERVKGMSRRRYQNILKQSGIYLRFD